MDPNDVIVSTKSTLGIDFEPAEKLKYALEQLRIAMKLKSHTEVIERAFREFLESYGLTFKEPEVEQETLERFGLAASGNVKTLDSARGKLKIFLPLPEDSDWLPTMLAKTRAKDFSALLRAALNKAHREYVRS